MSDKPEVPENTKDTEAELRRAYLQAIFNVVDALNEKHFKTSPAYWVGQR